MISTKHWVDSLRQQYNLATGSADDLELLLAVRRFIAFLNDSPHARGYIRELDYRWEEAQMERRDGFCRMDKVLSELEQQVRKKGGLIRSQHLVRAVSAELTESSAIKQMKYMGL